MKKTICDEWPISNGEYEELNDSFGNLARYAAWRLLKQNSKNNHTDEFDDVYQELSCALVRAASYYKRQVYIENCFIRSLEYIGNLEAMRELETLAAMKKYLGQEARAALARVAKCPVRKRTVFDSFLLLVLRELLTLWHNRKRHGASRQKFGFFQEVLLETIVKKAVPKRCRPERGQLLQIDCWFTRYCKAICWNRQKSMGKKITKEKAMRSSTVSLSEHDYFLAYSEI